jgi:plastocyanin
MRTTEKALLPACDRAKKMAITRPLAAGDGDVPCDGIGSAISRCVGRRPIGVRWWTAVVGLSFAAMAPAANHVVTASPNFTFSPSNLNITAGDTVTFRNGGGFHNVLSDPGSVTPFRCANGCDGAGGDGDLSSASWSATVAFPTAGTIGYYCEAHGSAGGGGMAGRIIVRAAPVPAAHWSDFNGDFNGDGRSDILWRNGSTGANVIWLSANSATTQTVLAVSTAWRVVGSGDYNGDGRADILWRNFSTGSNSIWRSANHLTPQTVTGVTNLAWVVVGSGDYNGDGRADILWRNRSTGANAIWLSANHLTPQAVTGVTNLAWAVVGSGDYNGNGRADILWRNRSTGANAIWLSANHLTPQAVTGVTNQAWVVVGASN